MKSTAKEVRKFFRGQYISGVHQKSDGSLRSFWGKIVDTPTENCVTYFDNRIKAYRRFRTDGFYYISNRSIYAVTVPEFNASEGFTMKPHYKTKVNSRYNSNFLKQKVSV